MKKLKLSKMAWLILSAGIFVVVLAGLGFTYSGQKSEQNTLKDELEVSKARLEKTQDTGTQQQIDQLEERLVDSQTRLDEAKGKLLQAILSVDVTEKFFQIAESSGVSVRSFGTTDIQSTTVSGVACTRIAIHGLVEGEVLELVNFIVNLNQNYITGYVTSAQISVGGETSGDSTANIQLEVYSSKGINDGK
jgi:hypothetical protein